MHDNRYTKAPHEYKYLNAVFVAMDCEYRGCNSVDTALLS